MKIIPFSVSEFCLENYLAKITSRSKIIYWIIILTVIAGIGVLPFVFVDVSVQARGFFQTEIERQLVTTTYQGKVVYSSVHNGNSVKKGDTLLIIDSETIKAQKSAVTRKIEETSAFISDLEILTENDSLELISHSALRTGKYRAALANLLSQKEIQSQKYLKKKSEHNRNQVLFDQEIIPKSDYEDSQFLLNSERDNLSQLFLNQQALWQSDLTARRIELIALQADLEQCRESLADRIILASAGGEIIQSTDIQPGSIVSAGQKIAEISPDGGLIANCFVKPADIGFVHPGQKVRIQVDAFNYNEWGMLEGEIIDISDDMIVENGSTAYFRVKCRPDRDFLSLKNGYKASIKKGMSLNTRIFVIRRSLFNLLFDKADKWFNPYTYKS